MYAKQILSFLILTCGFSSIGLSQDQGLRETIESFQQMIEKPGVDVLEKAKRVFVAGKIDQLTTNIGELRKRVDGEGAADILVSKDGGQFVYELDSGMVSVEFTWTEGKNPRIDSVKVTTGAEKHAPASHLTWQTLDKTFDAMEKKGFSGAVLLTRDGKIAFHKAYGMANREKKIKNTIGTVFAIGSAPIDFTHASLLILKDEGRLSFSDPISKYFKNVPGDKKTITIKHLMTGGSGLKDFHDLPGDKEPDHTWIDRDEAVRRIMNHKLLFEPGTGNAHSHSAWGLLAAIVEISSGQTYQDFTRERLFEPAGMKDTGFFGDKIPESQIAVGYGHRKSSEPNSPPHWGKTSWLVLGSGGQVSTLTDLHRWEVAIREGKILSPKSTKAFVGSENRVSADGDSYGFEFIHSHNPESMFMLISNSVNSRDALNEVQQTARALHALTKKTEKSNASQYSLGIAMEINQAGSETQVVVKRVVPGSAAEKAGIEVGDILVSVNDAKLGDPAKALFPQLNQGKKLKFVINRGEDLQVISVQPTRK